MATLVDPPQHDVQRRVATVAVAASTVRNAGAPGVVAAARDHLVKLDLRPFAVESPSQYASALERATRRLQQALPQAAQSWGVSRKCLNIFLRDALYNWYLRTRFVLARGEAFFEAPLDGIVARGLRQLPGGSGLPPWPGVKHLTRDVSKAYQEFAIHAAARHGVHRVHLDLYLWADGRP